MAGRLRGGSGQVGPPHGTSSGFFFSTRPAFRAGGLVAAYIPARRHTPLLSGNSRSRAKIADPVAGRAGWGATLEIYRSDPKNPTQGHAPGPGPFREFGWTMPVVGAVAVSCLQWAGNWFGPPHPTDRTNTTPPPTPHPPPPHNFNTPVPPRQHSSRRPHGPSGIDATHPHTSSRARARRRHTLPPPTPPIPHPPRGQASVFFRPPADPRSFPYSATHNPSLAPRWRKKKPNKPPGLHGGLGARPHLAPSYVHPHPSSHRPLPTPSVSVRTRPSVPGVFTGYPAATPARTGVTPGRSRQNHNRISPTSGGTAPWLRSLGAPAPIDLSSPPRSASAQSRPAPRTPTFSRGAKGDGLPCPRLLAPADHRYIWPLLAGVEFHGFPMSMVS